MLLPFLSVMQFRLYLRFHLACNNTRNSVKDEIPEVLFCLVFTKTTQCILIGLYQWWKRESGKITCQHGCGVDGWGGNIKITWKTEAKVAGGRHETNLPGFISRPSVLGCSVNTFPYEFMCPGRIPARGRENKVQTVVMWLWGDQSADPITLPASENTPQNPTGHCLQCSWLGSLGGGLGQF